jgi:CRISPR-associated protein Csd2
VFKHRSVLGNARSQDLFKLVKATPKQGVKVARSYDDYIVEIDRANLPDGVEIIERL